MEEIMNTAPEKKRSRIHPEKMTADAIPGAAELEKLCFAEPWSAKSLELLTNDGIGVGMVCRKDGIVCAYGGMLVAVDEGQITNIATHPDFTDEELREALKRTDYGLCVFHANNDVNDHQIVNMEFEDGETVSLNVNAFNIGGRYIRIYGTKGELYAHMSDDFITVSTYEDMKTEKVPVRAADEMITGGHGGGDEGIIRDLYDYLTGDYRGFSVADIHISVANHMIGFAAQESLHNDTVVNVDGFCEKYGFTAVKVLEKSDVSGYNIIISF